jgi:hypothetical protein
MAFKKFMALASLTQRLTVFGSHNRFVCLLGRKNTQVFPRFLLVAVRQIAKVAPDVVWNLCRLVCVAATAFWLLSLGSP